MSNFKCGTPLSSARVGDYIIMRSVHNSVECHGHGREGHMESLVDKCCKITLISNSPKFDEDRELDIYEDPGGDISETAFIRAVPTDLTVALFPETNFEAASPVGGDIYGYFYSPLDFDYLGPPGNTDVNLNDAQQEQQN